MKSFPYILFSSLLSVSVLAQQGAMPPRPGTAPATTIPAGVQNAPTTVDAATTAMTISGDAMPANAGLAAAAAAAPGLPSEEGDTEKATPTAPGEAPPGLPDSENPDGSKKVDFLQRSNLIIAKLLDSERAVDPFGLVMDPANTKEAPMLADQYEEEKETTVVNNSMLKNALLTMPITGVYPQRGLIVIGARSFDVGDQFGMKLQDLTIRLRFEGVRNGELYFKDMETREVTSVPYNTLPAEFEPMVKGSKRAPGSGIVPMTDLFIVN